MDALVVTPGVDGIFADFPDRAMSRRDKMSGECQPKDEIRFHRHLIKPAQVRCTHDEI